MTRNYRAAFNHVRVTAPLASAISAILASSAVRAQEAATAPVLESVIVTAQKRSEDLQQVPMSIQALGNEKLEQMHVADFDDYAKLLPNVSFQTIGPGFARVYMRGVSSGDNGNHSGSLPSVGMYLDEQPITTIQGPLDLHLYDIARVEVLAGPQGTLYGASSQAGTIRIITNKPNADAFEAGVTAEGNTVSQGSQGYAGEGFVNIPLGANAAIRLVGWATHDAGYIDNVRGTRFYGTSGVTIDNAGRAKEDYNDVDTFGGRAALKVDLNDSWTITPTLMAQQQKANGNFAMDPAVGDLEIMHFYPESSNDRFVQAALTVEGKISNFDLTYAGAYLKRNVESHMDYTDYSFFYDAAYGQYIVNDANQLINPSQYVIGFDRYKRLSHELRISSPQDRRARFVAGVFMQRQVHNIEQRYLIDNLTSVISITGWPDTIWLTEQQRVDRDYAAFGELTFDFVESFSGTAGLRYFKFDNTLQGFYGLSQNYSGGTGEAACPLPWVPFHGAPCTNLDKGVDDNGVSPKLNLTYKFNEDALTYVTWSRGFRPGGVNRRGTFPAYKSDYLTNFEAGLKTTWLDGALRFNAAGFVENWKDFQFSFLGPNGLTNITNAGQARIIGVESELEWAATRQLTLNAGFSWLQSELSDFFCKQLDANQQPLNQANCPVDAAAPEGARLPNTPKFKGNATGRYEFSIAGNSAHLQASVIYTGDSRAALLPADSVFLPDLSSSTEVDISAGLERGKTSFELFVTNATDERREMTRYVECATQVCGPQPYTVVSRPRTIGVKLGQKF